MLRPWLKDGLLPSHLEGLGLVLTEEPACDLTSHRNRAGLAAERSHEGCERRGRFLALSLREGCGELAVLQGRCVWTAAQLQCDERSRALLGTQPRNGAWARPKAGGVHASPETPAGTQRTGDGRGGAGTSPGMCWGSCTASTETSSMPGFPQRSSDPLRFWSFPSLA